MTLAINNVDESGFSNTLCHESLTKDRVNAVVAIEEAT